MEGQLREGARGFGPGDGFDFGWASEAWDGS
jgi:hypothetical protein